MRAPELHGSAAVSDTANNKTKQNNNKTNLEWPKVATICTDVVEIWFKKDRRKILRSGSLQGYRKKVFRHVFRSLESGDGEREVVKRVIPRSHGQRRQPGRIHLKHVGLDNFEPSPTSPIHAVCTSAGNYAAEYAERYGTGDRDCPPLMHRGFPLSCDSCESEFIAATKDGHQQEMR